jgi:hypothetical protein
MITMSTPSLKHLRSSVDLPLEVRQAASRHWRLFPVQELSRFAQGKIELATCNIDELEQLALEYPACSWALATGQASGIFALEMAEGATTALHYLNREECECEETLQSTVGEIGYAFFRWPADRILCDKVVAAGLRIRGENDSVLIPPSTNRSGVHAYRNPEARIMTSPNWLLKAFNELEEKSSGNILPFPVSPTRLAASANRAAESSTAKILPFNFYPTPRT